jgi:SPP1 gp7 family putative phage head morphogenesis protein
MQSILKYYAFTFFCLNNWASMTETFGKPFILGKYSPASTAAEQAKLLELVQSAGTDMAGIISESTAVEFVTYADKQASSDLYNNLIKFAQDRATRRILGQTLTTQEGDTGSYAQAKVHDLVRSDILAGDMRDANALLMQVLNMISAINLGIAGIETKVSPTQAKNPGESIIVDEKLNGIIEIDPDYFYEKYNIPIPQSGPAFVQKAEPTLPFQDSSTFEMVADLSNGRAAKNSGTPASCRHSLPVPVGPCMSLKLPGSTTKALSSFHKSLKELKSYDDVKNIAYPTDLYLAQGNDMWYLVLKNYIAVRKQQGSKAKAFIDNSSPSRGEVIQLDSWMDDGLSPSSPLLSSPLGTRTSLSAPPSALNIDFEFTDTDLEALNAFRAETFIVAGVSSQSVLDLVKSEAEKAFTQGITFTDFQKNLKLQGFEPDNPYFLRTNFNTAVSNANFAARWKNIDADRNLFPYLKYVAVMDNNTRDEHAALDGIVRPIDDPFWSSDYPPNGWNCRCSVEQLTASEANEDPGTDAPIPPNVVPPQFRRNAGKDNTLFGSWLGCDDAKNAMESMPFLESSGLRLHLLYALKQHCPSLYALKAGDLGLQPWENLKANKLPDLIDTSTMSRNELLTLWETTMGDRLVIDATSDPVRLKKDSSKWNKTKKDGSFSYSEADLKNRFKYLNCVEDTLQKPSEIWAEEKTRRYRYLKKYDTGLMLVTELDNNGNATMFNILATDKKYLDSRRSGFLIHTAE